MLREIFGYARGGVYTSIHTSVSLSRTTIEMPIAEYGPDRDTKRTDAVSERKAKRGLRHRFIPQ